MAIDLAVLRRRIQFMCRIAYVILHLTVNFAGIRYSRRICANKKFAKLCRFVSECRTKTHVPCRKPTECQPSLFCVVTRVRTRLSYIILYTSTVYSSISNCSAQFVIKMIILQNLSWYGFGYDHGSCTHQAKPARFLCDAWHALSLCAARVCLCVLVRTLPQQ